jgi:hypothetical protein
MFKTLLKPEQLRFIVSLNVCVCVSVCPSPIAQVPIAQVPIAQV